VRVFVEAWDPEFGSPVPSIERTLSRADVDPSVEIPERSWKPIPPGAGSPTARLALIDGVRRVDAPVWIEESGGRMRLGLCASYAAGAASAAARAEIRSIQVRRELLTSARGAFPFETEAGAYVLAPAAGESLPDLFSSLQERLRRLEVEVAAAEKDFDLLVVDGPLSTHHAREGVVGYVKTHHVSYLPPELERVVGSLEPSERTPLFLATTSYRRYSTYLRLAGALSHPFSGVVRLEVGGDLSLSEAVRLAGLACRTLPRYASLPHKDPRAPQNLFPIGALERELRRRLGDHAIVHRALRAAAAIPMR
jgi:hypothetical protein